MMRAYFAHSTTGQRDDDVRERRAPGRRRSPDGKISSGTAMKMSTIRISSSSSLPPSTAARLPMITPTTTATATTVMDRRTESRAPQTMPYRTSGRRSASYREGGRACPAGESLAPRVPIQLVGVGTVLFADQRGEDRHPHQGDDDDDAHRRRRFLERLPRQGTHTDSGVLRTRTRWAQEPLQVVRRGRLCVMFRLQGRRVGRGARPAHRRSG